MKSLNTILTPMTSNVLIDKDENGVEIEITQCQGIIGSLF